MELNEAQEVLNENGYLMESVKIDFSPLDNELKSVRRNIEETKEKFQALTEELQEKLFSNIEVNPDIYILKNYPFYNDKFTIVYEFDNWHICVNENWNVSINEKLFEVWNQKAAVQTILDNVK